MQAVSPLVTFTWPETRLCGSNPNVTVRSTGAVATVKSATLVATPPGVVSETLPVVAPVGTVAVTDVAVLVVNVAVVPLNLTEVTPVRFVPVMTTLVPTLPLVGANDVIVGAEATVKLAALFAGRAAAGVVTWIGPFVALSGTTAVICVGELITKVVAVVLNTTLVAPQKFVPVMTTLVPAGPLAGANPVIVAAGFVTVKLAGVSPVVVALPDGASTAMTPVVAVQGTTAVIDTSLTTVNENAFVPPNRTAVALLGMLNPEPAIVTTVPGGPVTGLNPPFVMLAADAGSAVTNTATSPSASANAVVRAEIFLFGNLIEGSSLLGPKGEGAGRHLPHDHRRTIKWRAVFES
jgi:hypothetical protein